MFVFNCTINYPIRVYLYRLHKDRNLSWEHRNVQGYDFLNNIYIYMNALIYMRHRCI